MPRRSLPGMGGMPGMMPDEDMKTHKASSGTQFERTFARMMIEHHDGAVRIAREVRRDGKDARVKDMAAAIERTHTAEVRKLQAILDRLS